MRYSEKALRYSGRSIRIIAPAITPSIEPMPPNTTTQRIMIDSHIVKLAGLIKVVFAANTTPPIPAHVAPSANAVSLVFVLSIPIA